MGSAQGGRHSRCRAGNQGAPECEPEWGGTNLLCVPAGVCKCVEGSVLEQVLVRDHAC